MRNPDAMRKTLLLVQNIARSHAPEGVLEDVALVREAFDELMDALAERDAP